ncbi:MAG: dTDP-glucose 4,6-dehydratase [Nitrospira sp.]|nr:dTDP-glucose 4,6-dehydratase [bacterium]MBL7048163.1 dTDP-glucose 4,6-dehydratase [Nitrospira sp.]
MNTRAESILITGGAGFIGSNFIPFFINSHPGYNIINLDKLTYAGDLSNLTEVEGNSRYHLVEGDICDPQLVAKLFREYDIRGVIHMAAESHVDNSITGPGIFIKTNLNGTFTLLEAAREYWMDGPFKYKDNYKGCRFHHISTDEVYGTLGETGLFKEDTPYAPNSPYSASKAGSDFLVRAYFHTYGMNVTTSNCSNNYGPKQHNEKLIPTIIRKALAEEPIPIYGDGRNIRDWLYVMDHCTGIDLVYHNGREGETYNIGGRNEQDNLMIAKTVCSLLDKKIPRSNGTPYADLITFVQDRAGHDRRYAIDASKIETDLNWKALEDFNSGINKTLDWYLKNKHL